MRSNVDLLRDEEILFEDERAVLTTRRLIGNFRSEEDGGFDDFELGDVGPPNKFNGGRQSKRALGLRLFPAGIAVVAAGAFIQSTIGIDQRVEAVVFVVGAISATVGLYILLNSMFRSAPNTTIIFPVIGGEDIIASFPDWDNPQADILIRQFARAKRGMGR